MTPPTKLYAYVDESGQDTRGQFFVVSVVLLGTERDQVLQQLEALELRSRKGRAKWRKARYTFRQAYIDGLSSVPGLAGSLFVTVFRETQEYVDLTVEATARAIHAKIPHAHYRVTIFVDGLTRHERPRFAAALRERHIARKKVRGVRDETSSAGVRLADALCGLCRDVEDGEPWATEAFSRLQQRGWIRRL